MAPSLTSIGRMFSSGASALPLGEGLRLAASMATAMGAATPSSV